MDKITLNFSKTLKRLRAEKNMTQEELAQQSGIDYKYLQKLPSGRFFIKTPSINKKQQTIGTFDSIEEAINAFNLKAEEFGFKKQEYIGELLEWSELNGKS